MRRQHGFWGAILFSISFFVASFGTQAAILETVYTENWESGLGDWDVSNGVWEVGTPTSGPGSCNTVFGGTVCAGTVLSGNYPVNTDSRLITPSFSPFIQLPGVSGMEEIRLRYWQWFSYAGGDSGVVQVSVFDSVGGWSAWESVGGSVVTGSGGWSRKDVDLTAYAGQRIRIAFFHSADASFGESHGWFVDDIEVIKLSPEFTGDFEGGFLGDIVGGWGDWSADRGVWQIGTPSSGPASCYSGGQCAGTRLDGDYPANTDSRLISAPVQLGTVSGIEEIRLRYWQWFSYAGGDSGNVQVSVFDPVDGWSAWESTGGSVLTGSGGWSRKDVDLTAYAGQKVRIAFFHSADASFGQSSGWFIDDIQVITLIPMFTGDFEGDFQGDVEGGWGDWSADRGVWQVGTPTSGPICPAGTQCAGTRLDGDYPANTDSRLISAPVQLETLSGIEEIRLRYWQWFSYAGGDAGVVQVSVFDPVDGWSAWESTGGSVLTGSGGWSRKDVDLTAYAGQKVRVAFFHSADASFGQSSGWFIDGIEVITKVPDFFIDDSTGIEYGDFEGAFPNDVVGGWGDWSADRGVWQIGTPTSGPPSCNAGYQCAGTRLDGNYPPNTDSRLISPTVQLPSGGLASTLLRYWQWFSFAGGDIGAVQISVLDPVDGWSDWTDIAGPFINVSVPWTKRTIDLAAYAGEKVRIAFFHSADASFGESHGWFIDDVRLPGVFGRPCEGDFDNDGDVDNTNTITFSSDFGRNNCSLQDFCEADFAKDGDVDNTDVFVFSQDFGSNTCFVDDPFE